MRCLNQDIYIYFSRNKYTCRFCKIVFLNDVLIALEN